MIRRCTFWMAALLAMCTSTAAWAAEDVFHVIPSNALAFVATNRLAETSATVQKLAKQVGAPPVSLLELVKAKAGIDKGLDETRSAAMVVMPGKDPKGEPSPLILAPVSDYAQFLESLGAKPTEKVVEVKIGGETCFVGKLGSYAAITGPEAGFRQALEKALDSKRSIADDYPQLASWLTENEVVALATSHGVKLASEQVQKQLRQMREMFSQMGEESASPVMMLEMYAKFFQWAEKEVDVVGIAGRVDKDGTVRITQRTRFVKGSSFGASVGKLQSAAKDPLVGLPAGAFVAAGGGVWSDAMMKGMASFGTGMLTYNFRMAYGIDEKRAEKVAKLNFDTCKGVDSISMMMGPGQPGEPIYSDVTALYHVDQASRFLENYEKQIRAIADVMKDGDKPAAKVPPFSVKKIKVEGLPALEVEMGLPQPPQAQQMPGFEDMMSKMFGPDGKMKMFFVAVDEHTVAFSLTSHAPILRAMAALKQPANGLAADPELLKTAKLLPTDAQWVGYVSPSGGVAFVRRMMDMMMPEGMPRPNIPEFPASPPIGVAVKALPGELQAEAVVPSAMLDAIGKYVGIVQSAEHPEIP